MADSYFQLATTPRLYISYPLWQYANGALDFYGSNVATNEELIKLIQLNPSKTISLDGTGVDEINLNYKINPENDDTNMMESPLWDFNYMMVLGHNLSSANIKLYPKIMDRGYQSARIIDRSNLINYDNWNAPEYDGWSLMELTQPKPMQFENDNIFRCSFEVNNQDENPLQLGSLLFGKYYDFPQNADLSETFSIDYGIKQKQTISGQTISTANWTKPNNWITEPFGLSEQFKDRGDNFSRRSGRRTWNISFDSLAPNKVMNQNPMLNSNMWKAQDNHSTYGVDNQSEYNINNSTDMFTNIVHRTMGGHLPMVMQLDKNVFSPESFVIVRLDSSFKINQKNPNLYNIKMKLTEQI